MRPTWQPRVRAVRLAVGVILLNIVLTGFMLSMLAVSYPDQYKLFNERDFTWNKIHQTNRNPLLNAYASADGLKTGPVLHPLQTAFMEHFAAQCGYCTPGMLMAAKALLDHNPNPSRQDVIDGIAGNICRCTGYEPIINAILSAAASGAAKRA